MLSGAFLGIYFVFCEGRGGCTVAATRLELFLVSKIFESDLCRFVMYTIGWLLLSR